MIKTNADLLTQNEHKNINQMFYEFCIKNKIFKIGDPKPEPIHKLNKNAEILFVGLNPGGNEKLTSQVFNCNEFMSLDDISGAIFGGRTKYNASNNSNGYYGTYSTPIHKLYQYIYDIEYDLKKNTMDSCHFEDSQKYEYCSGDIWRPKFEHIDLYPIRNRDSKEVLSDLKEYQFLYEPAKLINEVLSLLTEVNIVVFNNNNSSNFIKERLKDKLKKKPPGTYILENSEYKHLNNKSFMFSGTMSYGRLDDYTLEMKGDIIKTIIKDY